MKAGSSRETLFLTGFGNVSSAPSFEIDSFRSAKFMLSQELSVPPCSGLYCRDVREALLTWIA
jgi:hypothetical protein